MGVQDHKAVGEGDTGPNTGGMGAYSPAPVVTPAIEAQVNSFGKDASLSTFLSQVICNDARAMAERSHARMIGLPCPGIAKLVEWRN